MVDGKENLRFYIQLLTLMFAIGILLLEVAEKFK